MGRKKKRIERPLKLDHRFGSKELSKFINYVMVDGKKSVAEKIVYEAMDIISKKADEKPIEVFYKALDNVKPVVEVKSRRIGGSTYQIPIEVNSNRQFFLACSWIIGFSRKRNEKGMGNRLANELMDSFKGIGSSVKKKEDTHRMAESNRAFAHLRW